MPSINLDWKNLGFAYLPTNGHVQADFADGKWGPLAVKKDPYMPMHVAANCLHYGQACFEGLKAFTTKSGAKALFRPEANAQRLQLSAERILMEAPTTEMFVEG